MLKMKIKIAGFLLMLFFFTACDNNTVYFQYHSINPALWNKDSLYTFDVDIENSQSAYSIYINVCNAPDYPNQNLWLFISEITPDGVVVKDTIEFYLADHRGKWLGSGAGSMKEMPVLYKQDFKFENSGTHTFKIGHGMRADELKGITKIGMRVEKVN